MIPPLSMWVSVKPRQGRGFSIWLPLLLVWLLLLLLIVPLLPLMVIVDLFLAVSGSRFSLTGAALSILSVLSALRGLRVDVQSRQGRENVQVRVD